MNNKKKLLLANLFALFAFATMIAGIKLLGLLTRGFSTLKPSTQSGLSF